ncbi:hypothetical protein [Corticimicrobacter populi]|uniref:hypothetical protein n=1 Tax=Corticimicrobacter populi TaxID=2175229 RepID=UPI00195849AE|nr:hypothetical protein [Corticimicrobacter populi]
MNTQPTTITQEQVLAFAIYEIRQLLAQHLGNDGTSDPAIRAAAHLAYALHNQASAILEGKHVNAQQSVSTIKKVDQLLETDFHSRLSAAIPNPTSRHSTPRPSASWQTHKKENPKK